MGIASFSRSPLLTVLLAPLNAVAAWLMPAQSASAPCLPPSAAALQALRRPLPPETSNAIKIIAHHAGSTRASNPKQCQTVARATGPRRLKVVREFDAGISPACAGRMVISGRMADVCAELDRMSQR
jgi:hypothetical protein